MFVRKDYRGKGFSRMILGELEAWAAERGATELVLETGVKQLAAIGLYEESGYRRIENYGKYEGNENSVCMRKIL
jgi:GNAT superfamily N-acetyltransferase